MCFFAAIYQVSISRKSSNYNLWCELIPLCFLINVVVRVKIRTFGVTEAVLVRYGTSRSELSDRGYPCSFTIVLSSSVWSINFEQDTLAVKTSNDDADMGRIFSEAEYTENSIIFPIKPCRVYSL